MLSKYEVIGLLGEGAYGLVHKAKTRDTGELVAIKKFKESEDSELVKKTTLREMKMLRNLRHPCIVELKDAFRKRGRLYFVFEYMEKNLLEVLEKHPTGLDPDAVRFCSWQMCRAIEFCHRQNCLHRDIKPENLLVDSNFRLKVCDFGFARSLPDAASKAGGKAVALTDYVATRWYRSPELLLGDPNYGRAVDLWSVGCVIGELTDGEALFPGEHEIDQLYIIQSVLGPLTAKQVELFMTNARFNGVKFPDMSSPSTLEKRFLGRVNKRMMQFMKGLLTMAPEKRMSAAEAVFHPLFEQERLREPEALKGVGEPKPEPAPARERSEDGRRPRTSGARVRDGVSSTRAGGRGSVSPRRRANQQSSRQHETPEESRAARTAARRPRTQETTAGRAAQIATPDAREHIVSMGGNLPALLAGLPEIRERGGQERSDAFIDYEFRPPLIGTDEYSYALGHPARGTSDALRRTADSFAWGTRAQAGLRR